MEINDDLLITFLLGEATIEESTAIARWRSESPANGHRFEQFQLLWETSKTLEFKPEIDVSASLQRLKQKISLQKQLQADQVFRLNAYPWIRIVAALLLLSGLGWLYLERFSTREMEFLTQASVQADTLSDGSVITLNKHSLLRYPEEFKGQQRQVWLTKGEAFFSVTPNKAKPFFIKAGNTTIRVVGTSFNVKNKNGNIEVIVETGIVQVSRNGKTVVLNPGEKVAAKQGATELIKQNNVDQLYNYYRSKEFIADDTPLWRMVQVLNEAYDSHILIGNKELYALPLNTTFKDRSLEDVLKVISSTFKIKIERKHNQIILY